MAERGEKIAWARQAVPPRGWSQMDLATALATEGALGLDAKRWKSRISTYEVERTPPPDNVIDAVSHVMGIPRAWFDDGKDVQESPVPIYLMAGLHKTQPKVQTIRETPKGILFPNAEPTGRIKVYGGISAGAPGASAGNTSSIVDEEIDVPIMFAQQDYGALIVQGDSMLPFLHPSDIVIFKDWRAEKPGHVVAAFNSQNEWFVKYMVYDGHRYRLRSFNDSYPDIEPPFSIHGYLVGFIRDDGPERLIRLNPYGLRPD